MAKIADFGLSRGEEVYVKKTMVSHWIGQQRALALYIHTGAHAECMDEYEAVIADRAKGSNKQEIFCETAKDKWRKH